MKKTVQERRHTATTKESEKIMATAPYVEKIRSFKQILTPPEEHRVPEARRP